MITRIIHIFIIAAVLATFVSGCSSGDNAPPPSELSLGGKVVDGYVNGATVTIYSDLAMTNQIGSGTTDSSGNFNVTLSVSTMPATVYMKSKGGTVIDTGMPAPTMFFVAEGTSSDFNITPFTDTMFKKARKDGLGVARSSMAGSLGLTEGELYGDPVANSTTLETPLYKVLGSGTHTSTFGSDYKGYVVYLSQLNLGQNYTATPLAKIKTDNVVTLDISVAANGDVTGTTSDGDFVTGKVQGSTIILNLLDDAASPNRVTRVSGSIGFLNSVAGNYLTLSDLTTPDPSTELDKGVFVASFLPATGLNVSGFQDVLSNLNPTGIAQRVLFRDVFGGRQVLGWGNVKLTNFDPSEAGAGAGSATSTTSNFHTVEGDNTTMKAGLIIMNDTGNGEILRTTVEGNNVATTLMALEYEVPGGGKSYVIVPIGSRRGIFLAVSAGNVVDGIGETYMTRSDALIPALNTGIAYNNTIAAVGVHLLGKPRTLLQTEVKFTQSFTTPATIDGTYHEPNPGEEGQVFNGSMIGFKLDIDNNSLGDTSLDGGADDYMMLVELYETGAMQGERVLGGCLSLGAGGLELDDCTAAHTIPWQFLKYWPATFVAFALEDGATPPSYTGTLDILARTLYSYNYIDYLDAYYTGTLTITGIGADKATLFVEDPKGESDTTTLAVDDYDGLYHIHGTFGPVYIDLYWPVGGTKATYTISEDPSESGTWTYVEVGEAFLTQ